MSAVSLKRLGLLVRSSPLEGRSNRDQLDIALAAAALGIELALYFIGEGVVHILPGRDAVQAGLPALPKAWSSLAELTTVAAFVDAEVFQLLQGAGADWALEVKPVSPGEMVKSQAQCDLLLVL